MRKGKNRGEERALAPSLPSTGSGTANSNGKTTKRKISINLTRKAKTIGRGKEKEW